MSFIMVKSRDDLEELKAFMADCPNELAYVLNWLATQPDITFPVRVEHPNDNKV